MASADHFIVHILLPEQDEDSFEKAVDSKELDAVKEYLDQDAEKDVKQELRDGGLIGLTKKLNDRKEAERKKEAERVIVEGEAERKKEAERVIVEGEAARNRQELDAVRRREEEAEITKEEEAEITKEDEAEVVKEEPARKKQEDTLAERKRQIREKKYGRPVLPRSYLEIKRLLEIEKRPIYAKALEEWTRKETLFTDRVVRFRRRVDSLKNEIYQLIGFFSVFQGVLLTVVSQSNLLHCNNQWSPISLSVVASAVTIVGVIQKLLRIRSIQIDIESEDSTRKTVVSRLGALRNKGTAEFRFAKFDREKKRSKPRFYTYFFPIIVSLIIFAAGFPVSMWNILCHPGPNPYPK